MSGSGSILNQSQEKTGQSTSTSDLNTIIGEAYYGGCVDNVNVITTSNFQSFPMTAASSTTTTIPLSLMQAKLSSTSTTTAMESSASNNSSPVHQQHYNLPSSYIEDPLSKANQDEISPAPGTSTAALIANKQRLLQKENLRRVMNPPKLERKHSSGDLHSRLKTRKILGVGETDNGDIHRSKISQVLGHNEHLYVKFPRGVWSWQAFLSALLLVQALLILFFPRQACQLKLLGIQQNQEEKDGLMMGSKYYAVSLLALSFLLWRFMFIRDKSVARTVQLVALLHFSSLCLMDLISAATTDIYQLFDAALLTVMGVRMGTVMICTLYLNRIGRATSGLRKSPSHKDLNKESIKKDG